MLRPIPRLCFFFFNDTATTEIYTLSLHDALPICRGRRRGGAERGGALHGVGHPGLPGRSEEHTSELQSQSNIVCRLLLEKKKKAKPSCLLRRATGHGRLGSLTLSLPLGTGAISVA